VCAFGKSVGNSMTIVNIVSCIVGKAIFISLFGLVWIPVCRLDEFQILNHPIPQRQA
jgi:hypothetical protein